MKRLLLILLFSIPCFAREYQVEIVSVHDGDTVKAIVSLGFGLTLTESIRLVGINAKNFQQGNLGSLREIIYPACSRARRSNW